MRRSPIEHLILELGKAFGKNWHGIELVARHYEEQKHVIVVATGIRQKDSGRREKRKRVATIVLKIGVREYVMLRRSINYSVAFPYPITLPELG
jgi:hypothetical protein